MEKPFLEINQLCKSFKSTPTKATVTVLKGIDLTAREGEVLALSGLSGSGKTTLLKLIAGLEDPDSGSIYLKGGKVVGKSDRLVAGHPSIRLAFQDFELMPHFTVRENIRYAVLYKHTAYRQSRTDELLEICGLAHLADRKPATLSGGQQQRVALAAALAPAPDLILMDEPFSHLDPVSKNQLKQDLIGIIRDTGTTCLLVSHDARDALSLADRIAVLSNGTIVQTGTPKSIFQQPATLEIAQLFGEINLIDRNSSPTLWQNLCPNLAPGQLIGFRPSVLRVVAQEEGMWEGVVTKAVFFGNFTQLHLHVAGLTLKAQVGTEKEWPTGMQVGLVVPGDQTCILTNPDPKN